MKKVNEALKNLINALRDSGMSNADAVPKLVIVQNAIFGDINISKKIHFQNDISDVEGIVNVINDAFFTAELKAQFITDIS